MSLLSNIPYILAAIFLLGVIVAVHEFGHFISARMVGIPVKEFSIGFGPKLIGWKSKKHDTLFKISLLPLGGYCMYYGETASDMEAGKEGEEVYAANDPRLYNNHSVWKRMFTVLAGPFMNFVLAIVLAIVMVGFFGSKIEGYIVSDFSDNSPAKIAGLEVGDEILSVNGVDIHNGSQDGLRNTIQSLAQPNEALLFSVVRAGETLEIPITPNYVPESNSYLIGITLSFRLGKLEGAEILPTAFEYTREASRTIIDALGKLFTTGEGFNETSGPIGVIQTIGRETQRGSELDGQRGALSVYLNLAVIISINLGLFNLLPIPGLDGARFLLMGVEAIRRKPLNQKIETYIHLSGYVLLFGLLIFVTLRDVLRLFQ